MTDEKAWFITGASRGMGVDFVTDLQAEIDAHRDLSTSFAFDELEPAGSAR